MPLIAIRKALLRRVGCVKNPRKSAENQREKSGILRVDAPQAPAYVARHSRVQAVGQVLDAALSKPEGGLQPLHRPEFDGSSRTIELAAVVVCANGSGRETRVETVENVG